MVRTTKYPYIVKEETSQGERAVVDGTSVAVSDIASDYYTRHLLIDKIVYTRGLTPAQVFCALAYHHDHKAELAHFNVTVA